MTDRETKALDVLVAIAQDEDEDTGLRITAAHSVLYRPLDGRPVDVRQADTATATK